jgi:creatinine amidohydrolase/Fe(II)-dependent formamide hydrolase-like protein
LLLIGSMATGSIATAAGPDTVRLESLTWTELRDRIAAGTRTVIVPTGGTEQNGPHMALGKHNRIVAYAADRIARQLGKAVVAPVIAYVPEGEVASREGHMAYPGTLSLPPTVFAGLLASTADSLRAHGFTLVCLLGDSGGNQAVQQQVADTLTQRWATDGVRVLHVGDYYSDTRGIDWLRAQGFDAATIGSHAGMIDTAQLMHVAPEAIRRDQLAPNGGGPHSGVDGDPSRATTDIGKVILDFRIDAAIRQIRAARSAR